MPCPSPSKRPPLRRAVRAPRQVIASVAIVVLAAAAVTLATTVRPAIRVDDVRGRGFRSATDTSALASSPAASASPRRPDAPPRLLAVVPNEHDSPQLGPLEHKGPTSSGALTVATGPESGQAPAVVDGHDHATIREEEARRLLRFREEARMTAPQWQRFLASIADLVEMDRIAWLDLSEGTVDDRLAFSLALGDELSRRLAVFLERDQMRLFERRFVDFALIDSARTLGVVVGRDPSH